MTYSLWDACGSPSVAASRLGFLVIGPNASGKTTAVKAALGTPQALAALASGCLIVFHPDDEVRGADRGIASIENAALRLWGDARAAVVVIEGTNRAALGAIRAWRRDASRSMEVLVTSMSADVMRASIQARCEKRRKRFRSDFWSEKALAYEGSRRYRNLASRECADAAVTHWPIDIGYVGQKSMVDYLSAKIAAGLS